MWPPPRPPQVWTPFARQTVVGLAVVLLIAMTVGRWTRPIAVPDPPGDGPRAAELSTAIDPNTADAAALSAVPGLGEARAAAIVAYRTAYVARHGGGVAFTAPRDLLPVRGIGASTVANLEPYLTFPTSQPGRQ